MKRANVNDKRPKTTKIKASHLTRIGGRSSRGIATGGQLTALNFQDYRTLCEWVKCVAGDEILEIGYTFDELCVI